ARTPGHRRRGPPSAGATCASWGRCNEPCSFLPPLDPAPLGRTAAVVRLRRDVGDRADLEAGGLQRTDRGLPAGTGALHEHVHLLHAVLGGLARGVLGGHLGRERRGLARALEPDVARGRPRDHGTVGVGDRDDRVVERALDVGLAHGDVLLLLAADLLRPGRSAAAGRHYFLPAFFLPATVFFGPLRLRALVLVRWPRTGRPRRCLIPW